MQFIIKAYDGEGMSKLGDHVIYAGGLLDDAGKMKGSVRVMVFNSREELDEYISNEPYVLERVWEKIEVERLNVVIVKGERF